MEEQEAINLLIEEYECKSKIIKKLKIYREILLDYNKKFNLIAKSTENQIWCRHILDSAQLIKFIEMNDNQSLSDLGSGAGFPGLVIALFNQNPKFHVKLYEKSKKKCNFLSAVRDMTKSKFEICENSYENHLIDSNYIVCRAFKKLPEILRISREIAKKPHKLIVLKGQNAQEEAIKAFKSYKYSYKLEKSMTDEKSKIIVADIF